MLMQAKYESEYKLNSIDAMLVHLDKEKYIVYIITDR